MPTECESCGTTLVEEKEGDKDLRCPNHHTCPAQLLDRVFHVAGRGAFDIEGLGSEAAYALWKGGVIQDEGDVFDLDRDAIATTDLFTRAPKKGEEGPQLSANGHKLLENLDKSKDVPLWRVVVAPLDPARGSDGCSRPGHRVRLDGRDPGCLRGRHRGRRAGGPDDRGLRA